MASRRIRQWKTLAGVATALTLCGPLSAGAEEPKKKAEAVQAAAETKPEVEPTEEVKPPAGFRIKKRGDTVVYCRKESPLGSRFPAEKCYDEAGIRELRSRPNWSESVKACGKSGCMTP